MKHPAVLDRPVLACAKGGEILFEFGLLNMFRFLAELKEELKSLRPALSDGPASINYRKERR